MKRTCPILLVALVATAVAASDDGSTPLFNGRDLTGWKNANCAPETWTVREGMIHCTGVPTGALRTTRQYENFILDLDWRHLTSGGNSGVFIWGTPIAAPGVPFLRGIEVQVLDHGFNIPGKNEWYTTHGDVFPIHGATMEPFGRHNGQRSFPSEERSKGTPEWNHYRIVCTNGVLRLHVNGKEVSGGKDCNYRKGYLALESEGAPVEFKDIRIQELPSSNPAADLVAPEDQGWRALLTGVDLRGWRTNASSLSRWSTGGERLTLRDSAGSGNGTLWTEGEFGDAEFVVDCRPAKPAAGKEAGLPVLRLRGRDGGGAELTLNGVTPGEYQRFVITLKGTDAVVARDGKEIKRLALPADGPKRGALGLDGAGGNIEFMNLYARDL